MKKEIEKKLLDKLEYINHKVTSLEVNVRWLKYIIGGIFLILITNTIKSFL